MNIPRPEYPRPRLVRNEWINLNGEWQFEKDLSDSGRERQFQNRSDFREKIIVPFAPESKLSGIGYTDFMKSVWYRRTFEIPADWAGKRVLLHFGAVDYLATVWINGIEVGRHRGGYTPFVFDITPALCGGENTVVVNAYDDTRSGLQPTGKQSTRYNNYGCCYTRSTGIWQTVWLEAVPDIYVKKLRFDPDVDNAKLNVRLELNDRYDGKITASASFEGEKKAGITVKCAGKSVLFAMDIPDPQLWNVGDPKLYDMEITAGEDRIGTYFGMRKVAINGKAIEINDHPVFQRLVLDQGYYPDGIYTAPTDEDLKHDIEMSMDAGFNGARLHMKVFDPRTSYWADHLGYLLWGEYPNWGLDETDDRILLSLLPEWLEAVERDYNSPAIVGWCPFNETKKHLNPEILKTVYKTTKALDPYRPVIDTSGYVHAMTDVYDVHDYDQHPEVLIEHHKPLITGEGEVFRNLPTVEKYEGQPYFVSEFGGIFWDLDHDIQAWGYGDAPQSFEEYYERLDGLCSALLDNPGICAFCYTQLTDVMQEKNGIYAFDRRVKFDMSRIKAIISKKAAIEK